MLKLSKIDIPRHAFSGRVAHHIHHIQLHAFADGSEKANGAVGYVREDYSEGCQTECLLYVKSRVAPLKAIILTRKELCAAKLRGDLVQRHKPNLRIFEEASFNSNDSQVILKWLHADTSSFYTFMANQATSMQQLPTLN